MKQKKKLSLSKLSLSKLLLPKKTNNSFNSFYYTGIASLVIIIVFFITPKLVILKNDFIVKSIEVKNDSKTNLEKVFSNKTIAEEQDDEVDNFQIFEDIFQYEDIPTENVRLSASTIKQLFEDTDYSVKDVRENKLVKPESLDLEQ